jgi:hypothetical protein
VGEAAPIGSEHTSHLALSLSSATIRATLVELGELGLVPAHVGTRALSTACTFIDQLLDRRDVAEYDRRAIEYRFETAESDAVVEVAARLLGADAAARLRRGAAPRARDTPARQPRATPRRACSRCSSRARARHAA